MNDSSTPPNSASRKRPTANLAKGIDELDAMGSLEIPKRASWVPASSENHRRFSASVATMAAVDESGGAAMSRDNADARRLPSESKGRGASSGRAGEYVVWPQWLFATVVLGAALWYLFNVQPPRDARSPIEVERRALTPGR